MADFSRPKNHDGLLHVRRLWGAAQETLSGETLHAEVQRMLEVDLHRLSKGEQSLLKQGIIATILFRISMVTSIKVTMPVCPRTKGTARRADPAGIPLKDR